MAKAFADRWGVPVRAGSADAVALLDSAIEDLAALAGDPIADADAAVAADDSLVLGHIYRAYLQLYGTTPEGIAAAGEILKRLDETFMGERELHHLRAARHWAEGDWEATTRSLERALLRHHHEYWRQRWGWDPRNPDMDEIERRWAGTEICWRSDPVRRAAGEQIARAFEARRRETAVPAA